MVKTGKFQVKDNKLTTLGKIPHLSWQLPQITMWVFHKVPEVSTMERQVKYQVGYIKSSELPQVKYGKSYGKSLVAAPEVKKPVPEVKPPDAAPEVKILLPGRAWNYLRTTLGNSTIDLRRLPEGACGNAVVVCGKVRT